MSGVGRAVAMEWVKARTTATWWGLLLLSLGLIALNVVLTASVVPSEPLAPDDAAADVFGGLTLATAEGQRGVISTGFQSAFLVAAVLGGIVGAVDFRHRTASWTFLAVPRRGVVAVAKLVVALGLGLLYGVVGQAASLGLAALTLAARGVDLQADAALWRSLALGVPGVAVWALVGAAVGLLLRNQVASILVIVGWVFLVDPIATAVLAAVGEVGGVDLAAAAAYTPGNASAAIVEGVTGIDLVPWWGGVLVILAYTVVITVPAVAVSLRRDVG